MLATQRLLFNVKEKAFKTTPEQHKTTNVNRNLWVETQGLTCNISIKATHSRLSFCFWHHFHVMASLLNPPRIMCTYNLVPVFICPLNAEQRGWAACLNSLHPPKQLFNDSTSKGGEYLFLLLICKPITANGCNCGDMTGSLSYQLLIINRDQGLCMTVQPLCRGYSLSAHSKKLCALWTHAYSVWALKEITN